MSLVAVRGATTAKANDPAAIAEATRALFVALSRANPALTPSSAVAAFLTVTPDLDAAFPAAEARALGFAETALLGSVEAAVPGAPERCIRVLVLFLEEGGAPIKAARGVPVYLGEAARLRPDWAPGPDSAPKSGGDEA